MKAKIISEKEVFNDRFIIQKAEIEVTTNNGKTHQYDRLRLKREDAAAVLIYHTGIDSFILIRQFRYPVSERDELLLEIPAGKIEHDQDPLETAIREMEEETGYVIPAANFQHLTTYYASPGYTTEKYHLFYAEINDETEKKEGGGLEEEGEFIELVKIRKDEFFDGIERNYPPDGKTLLAGRMMMKKFGR